MSVGLGRDIVLWLVGDDRGCFFVSNYKSFQIKLSGQTARLGCFPAPNHQLTLQPLGLPSRRLSALFAQSI